jgi:hypothetical protein
MVSRMPAFAPRPLPVLAALLAGAVVALLVVAAAGGGAELAWVAIAGGAACACGLVVGSTARVVPAALLAVVAAGALVLAVSERNDRAGAEVRPFPSERAKVVDAPRAPTATTGAVERAEPPAATRAKVPAPVAPPVTPPGFVHRFYAALEAGRFEQAWERLGPAIRAREGTLDAWRAGYATTVSQRVEGLRVEAGDTVRHTLVTVDRTPCGTTTERRFEMLWYLQRSGSTYTARDLVGVQLAGVDPALACG